GAEQMVLAAIDHHHAGQGPHGSILPLAVRAGSVVKDHVTPRAAPRVEAAIQVAIAARATPVDQRQDDAGEDHDQPDDLERRADLVGAELRSPNGGQEDRDQHELAAEADAKLIFDELLVRRHRRRGWRLRLYWLCSYWRCSYRRRLRGPRLCRPRAR